MGYVRIKIQKTARREDLQKWEENMLEKAKCWNKFCLGICSENELQAVYVAKDGNDENLFLTTLCEDCIRIATDYGLLVNEKHLILETQRKGLYNY